MFDLTFFEQVNKVDRGMIPFRIQHVGKAVRVDEGSEVPFEKLPVEALLPEQEATLQELFPAKFKPCQHSDTTSSPVKPTDSS